MPKCNVCDDDNLNCNYCDKTKDKDKVDFNTPKQREAAFRSDLAELLAKHNAEINITDDGKRHGQHSGIAVVTMTPEWDDEGNKIAEYTEFMI
jgi:hypothetical protein